MENASACRSPKACRNGVLCLAKRLLSLLYGADFLLFPCYLCCMGLICCFSPVIFALWGWFIAFPLLPLLYGTQFLLFPIYHVGSGTWLRDRFSPSHFLAYDNLLFHLSSWSLMCKQFVCFLPSLISTLFQIKYLSVIINLSSFYFTRGHYRNFHYHFYVSTQFMMNCVLLNTQYVPSVTWCIGLMVAFFTAETCNPDAIDISALCWRTYVVFWTVRYIRIFTAIQRDGPYQKTNVKCLHWKSVSTL